MTAEKQSHSGPRWQSVLKAPFEWLDTGLDWFERSALIVCILAMATVSVANVMSRNIFGSSLQYANDVAQILLVIVTFMGIGIGARHARHIRVSAVHDLLPKKAQKVLLIFVSFTTAGLLFMLANYGWAYATAAQRSCRVLPEAVSQVPLVGGVLLVVLLLAVGGHCIRQGHEQWLKRSLALQPMVRHLTMAALLVVGFMLAAWLFGLFVELVGNRTGRCRVMSSTGFPVYITYMIVPLGFLLGGIQFFLAGVRNLISADNYLSWYNKDEYDTAEELAKETGLPAGDLDFEDAGTDAVKNDNGGKDNG
ncbi:MAG: TRAP transporter small permease [Halomonadaceae bacterium]|nr:MAG: TRAP transporter small permease [Halomonadaceae bacterium]